MIDKRVEIISPKCFKGRHGTVVENCFFEGRFIIMLDNYSTKLMFAREEFKLL